VNTIRVNYTRTSKYLQTSQTLNFFSERSQKNSQLIPVVRYISTFVHLKTSVYSVMTTCAFMHADEGETDVTDVAATESSQVATAGTGSPTDEDVTGRESFLLASLGEMIYHFLANTIDIKRSKLTDKLAAKDILSPDERQKIKELKKADAMVKSLLMMLREKSASDFESFLTTLSETGQQSVVDVVRDALRTVRRTGHNPLQYTFGMTA